MFICSRGTTDKFYCLPRHTHVRRRRKTYNFMNGIRQFPENLLLSESCRFVDVLRGPEFAIVIYNFQLIVVGPVFVHAAPIITGTRCCHVKKIASKFSVIADISARKSRNKVTKR